MTLQLKKKSATGSSSSSATSDGGNGSCMDALQKQLLAHDTQHTHYMMQTEQSILKLQKQYDKYYDAFLKCTTAKDEKGALQYYQAARAILSQIEDIKKKQIDAELLRASMHKNASLAETSNLIMSAAYTQHNINQVIQKMPVDQSVKAMQHNTAQLTVASQAINGALTGASKNVLHEQRMEIAEAEDQHADALEDDSSLNVDFRLAYNEVSTKTPTSLPSKFSSASKETTAEDDTGKTKSKYQMLMEQMRNTKVAVSSSTSGSSSVTNMRNRQTRDDSDDDEDDD